LLQKPNKYQLAKAKAKQKKVLLEKRTDKIHWKGVNDSMDSNISDQDYPKLNPTKIEKQGKTKKNLDTSAIHFGED